MNNMRKLMETIEKLDEEYVEYRDPEGRFQVIYDFPRGYFAVGKNNYMQDISGESFDDLDDAIEHAEICLSMNDDEYADAYSIDEAFGDDPDPYHSVRTSRKATMALHDAMDEGMADPRAVADACLRYMSEADVADMAENEGLLYDEWEDDYS